MNLYSESDHPQKKRKGINPRIGLVKGKRVYLGILPIHLLRPFGTPSRLVNVVMHALPCISLEPNQVSPRAPVFFQRSKEASPAENAKSSHPQSIQD